LPNAFNFGCDLAYYRVIRVNVSMLSARIQIVSINVGLQHLRAAISADTSEAIEILAQFIALDTTAG